MKPAIFLPRHQTAVMLEWIGSGDGARLMLLLQHDEARNKSWLVISMKND
jgi:hypothetical protein